MEMVNRLFQHCESLLATSKDLFFPQRCLICRQAANNARPLCQTCKNIVINQRLDHKKCCAICCLPLSLEVDLSLHCAKCIQHRPLFERCIAASSYTPMAARLINGLKHYGHLPAREIIADEILLALNRRIINGAPTQSVDMVIAVPIHRHRLRQRGFNQAVEIGKSVCRQLSLPLSLTACKRLADAPSQQLLDSRQRAKNLHNAFVTDHTVVGKRVAVIDDVATTLSTANAVASSVLGAGALCCEIWCFARTPSPQN